MKRLLESLKPNLGRVTHRFERAGIRTEEELSGLTAMLHHRRRGFLRDELHLTAFEVAIIDAALVDTYSVDR